MYVAFISLYGSVLAQMAFPLHACEISWIIFCGTIFKSNFFSFFAHEVGQNHEHVDCLRIKESVVMDDH